MKNLLPDLDWHNKFTKYWDVGEEAALSKLEDFIKKGINKYKEGRNYPGENFVSKLSPYLHFVRYLQIIFWKKLMSLSQIIILITF